MTSDSEQRSDRSGGHEVIIRSKERSSLLSHNWQPHWYAAVTQISCHCLVRDISRWSHQWQFGSQCECHLCQWGRFLYFF